MKLFNKKAIETEDKTVELKKAIKLNSAVLRDVKDLLSKVKAGKFEVDELLDLEELIELMLKDNKELA